MESTAQRIREHIANLADGEMFATQEILYCGGRTAIDLVTHNMVKDREIVRVARGVFIKRIPKLKLPKPIEIAKKKAKIFKKEITEHGINAAIKLRFIDKDSYGSKPQIYYTNGCSSSFQTKYGEIKFQSVSKRKFELLNSVVGILLKAIWYLGYKRRSSYFNAAKKNERNFSRIYRISFRSQILKVPNWIRKMFFFYSEKRGTKHWRKNYQRRE